MRTAFAALVLASCITATEPDAATRNWWKHVQFLANDGMKGRDTGSPEYRKAAEYVARQFERAGLQPAGERGYFQNVPMHRYKLDPAQTHFELIDTSGRAKPLELYRQIMCGAGPNSPSAISGPLVFVGTAPSEAVDLNGKIVVQLGRAQRPGALAILTIDTTSGPEPPRWPVAYAATVRLREDGDARGSAGPPALRFNPANAEILFEGSGHTYKELVGLHDAGKPLPSFTIPLTLRGTLKQTSEDIESDNVLALLPGSSKETVVLSAHLDGYGVGTSNQGDGIYNGAFDDAAYVATLIDFAENLERSGTKLKRSILFAVVTGEEKGLLGSKYYVQHLTAPKESLVANINLDQLRPIFPLKLLTTLALDESTLGDTVKQVASSMDIGIQPDPEPGRNLLRRSDHINFMNMGVPAVGFIFGYRPGSPEEGVYRKWYADRYHSPKDDLDQPWDPQAAAKFNTFFGKLVETVANAPDRPQWKAGSSFAKR